MVRIAKYNIEIGAVANGVTNVFRRVTDQADNMGSSIKDALSFAAGNFFSLRTLATDIASVVGSLVGFDEVFGLSDLANLETRLGATAGDLQTIQNAGADAKVEFDDIADFLTEITKRASEAAIDGGAIADVYENLGIDPSQFRFQDPLDQLEAIQNGLAAINSQSDRLFLLDEIAGDVGVRVSNIFTNDGVSRAREFFDAIGGPVGSLENIRAAEQAFRDIQDRIDLLQQRAVIGLAPAFTTAADAVSDELLPVIEELASEGAEFIAAFVESDEFEESIAGIAEGVSVIAETLSDATRFAIEFSQAIGAFEAIETLFNSLRFAGDGARLAIADANVLLARITGTQADVAAAIAARDDAQQQLFDNIVQPSVDDVAAEIEETINVKTPDLDLALKANEKATKELRDALRPQSIELGTSAAREAIDTAVRDSNRRVEQETKRQTRVLNTIERNTRRTPNNNDQTINVTIESVITCE